LAAEATTHTAIVLCILQLLFPPGLLHTLSTLYLISFLNELKNTTKEASLCNIFHAVYHLIFHTQFYLVIYYA
jgi:hypothetical protein